METEVRQLWKVSVNPEMEYITETVSVAARSLDEALALVRAHAPQRKIRATERVEDVLIAKEGF